MLQALGFQYEIVVLEALGLAFCKYCFFALLDDFEKVPRILAQLCKGPSNSRAAVASLWKKKKQRNALAVVKS